MRKMKTENRKALEQAKVGDIIIINTNFGRQLLKIIRIGNKYFFTQNNRGWRKTDGREKGGGNTWGTNFCKLATSDEIASVNKASRRRRYIENLQNTDYQKLSEEVLKKLCKIIYEAQNEIPHPKQTEGE